MGCCLVKCSRPTPKVFSSQPTSSEEEPWKRKLLGVVSLWEHLRENWNQQSPDIYSELIEKMED